MWAGNAIKFIRLNAFNVFLNNICGRGIYIYIYIAQIRVCGDTSARFFLIKRVRDRSFLPLYELIICRRKTSVCIVKPCRASKLWSYISISRARVVRGIWNASLGECTRIAVCVRRPPSDTATTTTVVALYDIVARADCQYQNYSRGTLRARVNSALDLKRKVRKHFEFTISRISRETARAVLKIIPGRRRCRRRDRKYYRNIRV